VECVTVEAPKVLNS